MPHERHYRTGVEPPLRTQSRPPHLPHRGKTCYPPAEPIAPQLGDPCPECRRNGANYGAIACKDEHFQQALAKHKLDSENWHKTWDELLPAASSPALGDEPSDFEPELPAGPIPMADHQVITFQSATHTGSIEWSKRFERYEATAAPRDWKKGKRLPPQEAYSAGTSAELKLKLREHVAGVQFADEPEKVGASVEARDARPELPVAVSKTEPATPARRAYKLPKTADGDTLLVLPEIRNVPPGIADEKRWVPWDAKWDQGKKKFNEPPRSCHSGKQTGPIAKNIAEFGTFAQARAAAEKFNCSGRGVCAAGRRRARGNRFRPLHQRRPRHRPRGVGLARKMVRRNLPGDQPLGRRHPRPVPRQDARR